MPSDRWSEATRWRLAVLLAMLTLFVSIGWLDVVRGRELTVFRTNQEWVMREVTRLRDELEAIKRDHRQLAPWAPRGGP